MRFNYRHMAGSGRSYGKQQKTKSGGLPIHFSVQDLRRTKTVSTQNQFLLPPGLICGGALTGLPVATAQTLKVVC